jgi:DNA polymerase III alpha subunit
MVSELTNKEIAICLQSEIKNTELKNILRFLLTQKVSKPRQQKVLSLINQLENPSYSLEDSIEWLSDNERELLGASITCTKTDSYDSSYANTDCGNIQSFNTDKQFFIVAEIDGYNVIKTKRGKNPGQEMCFLKLSDSYGSIDCVVFPDEYSEMKNLLEIGRVLMFNGQKSKKDHTPVVKKCFVV